MKMPLVLALVIVALTPKSLSSSIRYGTIADGYGPAHNSLENVVVIELPQPSTPRPQITVRHDGKPIADARLYVYRFRKDLPENYPQKLHLSLVTNVNGQIVLPRLRPGIYMVVASTGPYSRGEILLSVAPKRSDPNYGVFQVNLHEHWGQPVVEEERAFSLELSFYPTREEILANEERLPATRVAAFEGTVCDMSGASIPNVSVEVTRMDSAGKAHAIRLKSDSQGKFASKLADGDYIATFSAQGFGIHVLHLVVSGAENNSHPLRIELQIMVTE